MHCHDCKSITWFDILINSLSYEQDDIPAKPAAAAKIDLPPEPVEAHNQATNGDTHDRAMPDAKEEPQPQSSEQPEQNSGGHTNEASGSGWQDSHANGDRGNDYGDTPVGHESHGTGIKEDG